MATVADVLTIPALHGAVEALVPASMDRTVEGVALIEDLRAVATCPPGSLVIVTAGASAEALGYRLDMLVRQASAQAVAALALVADAAPRVGRTTEDLAARAGLALLRLSPGTDVAAAIVAVDRELAGGAARLTARVTACLDLLDAAERDGMSVAATIARVEDVLGMPVARRVAAPADGGAALVTPLQVDGEPAGTLTVPAGEGGAAAVRRLVLHRVARAVEHMESARQRAVDAPIQTRAELLTELLVREPHAARDLVRRARALDIPIDGWHVVVRLELENLDELRPDDEVGVLGLTQLAARLAMEATRSRAGAWNRAGTGGAVLLVHSRATEAPPELQDTVAHIADFAIARVRSAIRGLTVRCGVGGVHVGVTGLRTSAMEARAAVAAALTTDRPNAAVRFDQAGLRRVLLQWYALDDARDSVARMLEPLDRLGPAKSREALRTVRAYLDGHRSLSRAAETLGLHRNTVRYRVERAFEVLGVDPDDAEQCLMLQLAWRAREL